ncbi:DUF3152 domain-containing protein [Corynebacterium sputi]|uniref:DUF3152 domain-containing protein n=1 Tax=Corynebacterium sputi TaxID=489915 RepID=UPI000A035F59|nr:DUF3152 domain-containing protein [Corynebacterium sputi]
MPQHSSHRRPSGGDRSSRGGSGTRGAGGRRSSYQEPRQESGFIRLLKRLSWRAYVVPLLLVVTAWMLVDVFRGEGPTTVNGTSQTQSSGTPIPSGSFDPELVDLPPGPEFAVEGSGNFDTVGVPGEQVGVGDDIFVRYTVEIEDVVDTSTFGGGDAFSSMIDATLGDPRGWTASDAFAFKHVAEDDDPDTVIRLVSTDTARELCGAEQFQMEVSCRLSSSSASEPDQVVLNIARWVRGAVPFQGDLGMYRQYLVNHEMGHRLGFAEHEACPENGVLAPLMMQQTLGLSNAEIYEMNPNEVYPDDDAVCIANSWPYPMGLAG